MQTIPFLPHQEFDPELVRSMSLAYANVVGHWGSVQSPIRLLKSSRSRLLRLPSGEREHQRRSICLPSKNRGTADRAGGALEG